MGLDIKKDNFDNLKETSRIGYVINNNIISKNNCENVLLAALKDPESSLMYDIASDKNFEGLDQKIINKRFRVDRHTLRRQRALSSNCPKTRPNNNLKFEKYFDYNTNSIDLKIPRSTLTTAKRKRDFDKEPDPTYLEIIDNFKSSRKNSTKNIKSREISIVLPNSDAFCSNRNFQKNNFLSNRYNVNHKSIDSFANITNENLSKDNNDRSNPVSALSYKSRKFHSLKTSEVYDNMNTININNGCEKNDEKLKTNPEAFRKSKPLYMNLLSNQSVELNKLKDSQSPKTNVRTEDQIKTGYNDDLKTDRKVASIEMSQRSRSRSKEVTHSKYIPYIKTINSDKFTFDMNSSNIPYSKKKNNLYDIDQYESIKKSKEFDGFLINKIDNRVKDFGYEFVNQLCKKSKVVQQLLISENNKESEKKDKNKQTLTQKVCQDLKISNASIEIDDSNVNLNLNNTNILEDQPTMLLRQTQKLYNIHENFDIKDKNSKSEIDTFYTRDNAYKEIEDFDRRNKLYYENKVSCCGIRPFDYYPKISARKNE